MVAVGLVLEKVLEKRLYSFCLKDGQWGNDCDPGALPLVAVGDGSGDTSATSFMRLSIPLNRRSEARS